MIATSTEFNNAISASVRRVKAKVEVYEGSTLVTTYTQDDAVKSVTIDRVGEEGKFFGFGVSQKANVKLIDVSRAIELSTANSFKISLGAVLEDETIEYTTYPIMDITEVHRDEVTNELSITAYDRLNKAVEHTYDELNLTTPYILKDVANAAATLIDGKDRSESENLFPELTLGTSEFVTQTERGTFIINGTIETKQTVRVNFPDGRFDYEPGNYIFRARQLGGTYTKTSTKPPYIYFYTTTEGSGLNMGTQCGFDEETDVVKSEGNERYWVYIQFELNVGNVFDNYEFELEFVEASDVNNELFEYNYSELVLSYPEGANFDGTESIQDVLTAIAEVTTTIYYVGADDGIHFKRLDSRAANAAALTIGKEDYINLDSSTNRRLACVCSVTELGDNIATEPWLTGTTQYIRNNPFLELRDDVATILEAIFNSNINYPILGAITINQFTCNWRGNPALEIGDTIDLVTKDDETVRSYVINDTIAFDGSLSETLQWHGSEGEEVAANPTSLGEVLKQTYARVDKANKEIEMLVSEMSSTTEAISLLQLNSESIYASVSKVEQTTQDAVESLNGEMNTLTKKVEATMTAEDVKIEIKKELSDGVSSVTTATGFTFDEEGLTINKTGSEMTTNIDEDGMSVYRDNEEVLTADNQGVTAYNLHAKTFLIIGEHSRFEDYEDDGEARTGCFWIGG